MIHILYFLYQEFTLEFLKISDNIIEIKSSCLDLHILNQYCWVLKHNLKKFFVTLVTFILIIYHRFPVLHRNFPFIVEPTDIELQFRHHLLIWNRFFFDKFDNFFVLRYSFVYHSFWFVYFTQHSLHFSMFQEFLLLLLGKIRISINFFFTEVQPLQLRNV